MERQCKEGLSAHLRRNCLTALVLAFFILLSYTAQSQCTAADVFTKITNKSGTASYAGTGGQSSAIAVTVTTTGSTNAISFCGLTDGNWAGHVDADGAFKFVFAPAVNGVAINLNALNNNERVFLNINGKRYQIQPADLICSGDCFGQCGGQTVYLSNGYLLSDGPNGTCKLIIQGVGPIDSLEYVNDNLEGNTDGTVFDLYINNSTCLLPVNLNWFRGNAAGNTVQINWQASTEHNFSHYEVQRSSNGRTFINIASIAAKGDASNYAYKQFEPQAGHYYYRLQLIDKDGKAQTSKVLSFVMNDASIQVTPNPATKIISINGLSTHSSIAIYNETGQQRAAFVSTGNLQAIDIAAWPMGLYIIKVAVDGKTIAIKKIMKQ